LAINLQALLESRDRRVDGRIFETAGKLCQQQSGVAGWAQPLSIASVIFDQFSEEGQVKFRRLILLKQFVMADDSWRGAACSSWALQATPLQS
jgi:hypothetical protein